ncbi:MAG: hypothetical protein AAF985_21975 [Bacteroidota bacterium]
MSTSTANIERKVSFVDETSNDTESFALLSYKQKLEQVPPLFLPICTDHT